MRTLIANLWKLRCIRGRVKTSCERQDGILFELGAHFDVRLFGALWQRFVGVVYLNFLRLAFAWTMSAFCFTKWTTLLWGVRFNASPAFNMRDWGPALVQLLPQVYLVHLKREGSAFTDLDSLVNLQVIIYLLLNAICQLKLFTFINHFTSKRAPFRRLVITEISITERLKGHKFVLRRFFNINFLVRISLDFARSGLISN